MKVPQDCDRGDAGDGGSSKSGMHMQFPMPVKGFSADAAANVPIQMGAAGHAVSSGQSSQQMPDSGRVSQAHSNRADAGHSDAGARPNTAESDKSRTTAGSAAQLPEASDKVNGAVPGVNGAFVSEMRTGTPPSTAGSVDAPGSGNNGHNTVVSPEQDGLGANVNGRGASNEAQGSHSSPSDPQSSPPNTDLLSGSAEQFGVEGYEQVARGLESLGGSGFGAPLPPYEPTRSDRSEARHFAQQVANLNATEGGQPASVGFDFGNHRLGGYSHAEVGSDLNSSRKLDFMSGFNNPVA